MTKSNVLISCIVLAIAVTGYAGYIYWTKTPTYALTQVAVAAESRDLALFHRYFNVETVVSRAVDVLLDSVFEEMESEPRSGFEAIGQAFAVGFIKLMKPRLVQEAKQQIDQSIEKGGLFKPLGTATASDSKASLDKIRDSVGTTFRGVRSVERDGKIAIATVDMKREDAHDDRVLKLMLRQEQDGHWQVVELYNLSELLEKAQAEASSGNEE